MAVVQFGPTSSTPGAGSRLPNYHTQVWTKSRWSDGWQPNDYIEPIWCVERALPGTSEALFAFRYGEILREDSAAYAFFQDLALVDHYVCIQVLPEEYQRQPYPIWCGIIPAEQRIVHATRNVSGVARVAGDQEIHAYGFDYVLRRRRTRGAWVYDAGHTDITAAQISWQPTFNERQGYGLTIRGNRATAEIESPSHPYETPAGVFGFGGADAWSAAHILRYLLYFSIDPAKIDAAVPMAEPWFLLEGDPQLIDGALPEDEPGPPSPGLLGSFYPSMSMSESNVMELINRIVSRQRGISARFTWSVSTTGDVLANLPDGTKPIGLELFSLLRDPIIIGDVHVPGNANVVDIVPESGIDVESATIESDSLSTYDRIVVQGERVVSVFTAQVGGGFDEGEPIPALLPAWSDADQTAYVEAVDDDTRRAQASRFERVYRYFKLDPTFIWQTPGHASLNPRWEADGTPKLNAALEIEDVGPIYRDGRPFLNSLPIPSPASSGVETDDRTFLAPFAIVEYVPDAPDEPYYVMADNPPTDLSPGADVRPGDRDGILIIDFKLAAHIIALNQVGDPEDFDTDVPPVYDYETILATVAMQADSRPSVIVDIAPTGSNIRSRELVIDMPGVHFWLAGKKVITGLNSAGQPIYHAGSRVLRDDTDRLRTVAAAAAAWYSRVKRRLNYRVKGLVDSFEVGTYVYSTREAGAITLVNSAVTERRWQIQGGHLTEIHTDFAELDFVGGF